MIEEGPLSYEGITLRKDLLNKKRLIFIDLNSVFPCEDNS